jgi:branched-chain amino acid aminotransferase
MTLAEKARTTTWSYVDGDWHEGNVALIGPMSHAMWLGSTSISMRRASTPLQLRWA